MKELSTCTSKVDFPGYTYTATEPKEKECEYSWCLYISFTSANEYSTQIIITKKCH